MGNGKKKLLVIDGGLSKAYQEKTGIAGYTLIYNSYGLVLSSHEPFEAVQAAIEYEKDMHSESVILESSLTRKKVMDTDIGKQLKKNIAELEKLLKAYREGVLTEKF
jgi:fructose-1,6-bisphosphatase-3